MEVIKEINTFYDLKQECWSGALDTLNTIQEHEKINELMHYLNEVLYDASPSTLTQLNNFLWFDREHIYEILEINTEEDY